MASTKIKAIVGLGNPGSSYQKNRHNVGFMVLEGLAADKGLSFKSYKNFLHCTLPDDSDNKLILVKPQTFMNLSGEAVGIVQRQESLRPEEICIVYDDFALDFGTLRYRLSGSAGGHNGIKSIIHHLKTENFPRCRVGIGPLPAYMDVSSFVLSNFTQEQMGSLFDSIIPKTIASLLGLNKLGLSKTMGKYNGSLL